MAAPSTTDATAALAALVRTAGAAEAALMEGIGFLERGAAVEQDHLRTARALFADAFAALRRALGEPA